MSDDTSRNLSVGCHPCDCIRFSLPAEVWVGENGPHAHSGTYTNPIETPKYLINVIFYFEFFASSADGS